MKIIENSSWSTIKEINNSLQNPIIDGISIQSLLTIHDGRVLFEQPNGIEKELTELKPSSKILHLSGCAFTSAEAILPLLTKFPNLIIEHFNVEQLHAIKKELLESGKDINITTSVKPYYRETYIESLQLDYEMHRHILNQVIIERINKWKKVLFDITGIQAGLFDFLDVMKGIETSKELHVITKDPQLIKKASQKYPEK